MASLAALVADYVCGTQQHWSGISIFGRGLAINYRRRTALEFLLTMAVSIASFIILGSFQ